MPARIRNPGLPLILVVDTTEEGSATNTFVLPLPGEGDYDCSIDWGDGTVERNTTNTDVTHVYSSPGTYTIQISGRFPRIYFNSSGDCAKLIRCQLGMVGWTNMEESFFGCNNLIELTAPVPGVTSSCTDFSSAWGGCSSLTSFPLIDTSAGTIFNSTWAGCQSLTSFPLIDTSSGTDFSGAWYGCSGLLSFPMIDTSSATTLYFSWYSCFNLVSFPAINTSNVTSFRNAWSYNYTLSPFPVIDTSSGVDFGGTWAGCMSLTSFPSLDTSSGQDFEYTWYECFGLTTFPTLNLRGMTDGTSCFQSTTLDTASYSALLIDMALGATTGVNFHGGGSKYDGSAVAARNTLTATRSWTITDGGLE